MLAIDAEALKEAESSEQDAAQQAAQADAASGRKIGAILKTRNSPTAFPIYQGGAA